jgi:hypothetical protein
MFNILFVGYSLAKNNLNSTYQYNMTPKKKNSKTMNYLKFKVSREVSRFLCRSVYLALTDTLYTALNNVRAYLFRILYRKSF